LEERCDVCFVKLVSKDVTVRSDRGAYIKRRPLEEDLYLFIHLTLRKVKKKSLMFLIGIYFFDLDLDLDFCFGDFDLRRFMDFFDGHRPFLRFPYEHLPTFGMV